VLRTIARDELRHATLAWRTLRWMVTSGLVTEDAARAALARGLAAMKENASFPGRHAMGDDLRAFGVLSDKRRGELRLAPANKVIATCTAALLGGRTSLLANALE
jgi:hypothetical protein